MKIVALQGSYRKNGNTAHVVELITSHMARLAAEKCVVFEAETIHLGHQNIGLCRGCRACFDLGEDHCPLKDDLLPIKEKIRKADGVIIASPVYVDDVNGITKNWIDRMAHVCHRPEFAGKAGFILTTTGSAHSSHALHRMQGALLTWGFHLSGAADLIAGARMPEKELMARFDARAAGIARKMFDNIIHKRPSRPSFASLMMFKIYQSVRSKGEGTFDTEYWRDKGWLDPHVKYYFTPSTNFLIVFVARLTGLIVSKIVT